MNSKNAYEFFSLGKKFAKENNNVKAAMLFEKAKKIEPYKSSIYEALGIAYFNCGLYPSAKKHFEIALKIDPSNDFAYYCLGLALAKEGKINQALGKIKIASAMKPENKSYLSAVKRYKKLLEKLKE